MLTTALGRIELSRLRLSQGRSRKNLIEPNEIKVVPKGLRSFDAEDKDFFLELLPGPRGNDGLPTSVRFWKTRIEERNPDRTFPVGLIYGPSGCGKSSLVKAGLLPRLSDTIQLVLVEATPDDTETRLLKGLRGAFPGLGSDLNLIDTFIKLRRESEATGRKTLIVIDQFEQWLHARTEEEKLDLALALRLCNGANIQCIIMIRDDFWLGTNRLMKDIGVRISEGENAALVDLFDVRHARKVLGLLADAYGVWENSPVEPTERAQFLDDAVSGLAQDDRVICVRIALFCELFQGKPWDLKTLKKAGGVEGVGVLFMEETFSADNAPAENRYHQKAVRSVLNALLPEPGSTIKGKMRSDRDLMEVSGYADRPDDFQALVRILDEKTHLITPTDPEGLGADEGGVKELSVGRFYQLTHDYLVPSIREWLTRKQRETRRGRAELRLADRSAIWAAKPENRQLPSLWEWSNIRLLTKSKDWTEPQRMMMKKAGRIHASRTFAALLLLGLLTWSGIEGYGTLRAKDLVESLKTADTSGVPALVKQIEDYRRWADSRLTQALKESEPMSGEHLHASLALLPVDASQVDYLFDRLIKIKENTPSELRVLRDALQTHRSTLTPKLWTVLESAKPGDAGLLPAASALASYDPDNPRWESAVGKVSQALVSVNSIYLGGWLEYLTDVRSKLTASLATIFRDRNHSGFQRAQATYILADYVSDDPNLVANLLMDADHAAYAAFFPIAQKQAAKTLPLFEAEIRKHATFSWDDPPLDPAWTKPDTALAGKIEMGEGMLT
ncbi:MAG TPA: ATP-binding protein, partial [Isosphaeraceae bacterium]|nr:ATP-binding protein [Isosphaeraceae bacterium]